jgi:hypothetical protein
MEILVKEAFPNWMLALKPSLPEWRIRRSGCKGAWRHALRADTRSNPSVWNRVPFFRTAPPRCVQMKAFLTPSGVRLLNPDLYFE